MGVSVKRIVVTGMGIVSPLGCGCLLYTSYLTQMTHLFDMELDAPRREELERQFARIAAMAQPLMDYPLGPREEIAGVYKA